jgi:hypothetical protein
MSKSKKASHDSAGINGVPAVRTLQLGEQTHQDYNQIIQLFEQINRLAHANEFTDNFTREEWFSLLGSWEGCGMSIRTKCDFIERCEEGDKVAFDPGVDLDGVAINWTLR